MANTQICEVCRSTNFEIVDGNFFCTQCFTQNDVSILIYSIHFDMD